MSVDDFNKLVLTVALQFVATFAGCVAALFFWKNVLQGIAIIN